jgi:hypothetical protein
MITNNGVNVEDELRRNKKWLASAKKTPPGLQKLRDDLRSAKENGATYQAIQDLESQIELHEGIGKQTVSNIEARIEELQGTLDGETNRKRQVARVELKGMKEQALRSWLDSGGSHEGFEGAWPKMEQEILMKDTMELIAEQTNDKRKMIGGL